MSGGGGIRRKEVSFQCRKKVEKKNSKEEKLVDLSGFLSCREK